MVWLREHKGVTQGPHLAAMKQQTLEALLHVVSLRLTEKTNNCGTHIHKESFSAAGFPLLPNS